MAPGSITMFIQQLRHGDRKDVDVAAQKIWTRYSNALLGLARRRLATRIRRREDEEDVLQSMYKSFCIRLREGEFDLEDRDDLWRLLVTITDRKARNVAVKHRRVKRDARREVHEAAERSERDAVVSPLMGVKAPVPTAEEAALLVEAFEERLRSLDRPLRQIALWKLEGLTNEEIADKLDCVVRSVERKLERIRKRWGSEPN
jgi:RNA polymerase sigma factor (sigma-70 family)